MAAPGAASGIPETAAEFEAFLEREYARIFRIALRILGNAADAEDLTQEICLALPGKLAGYRGRGSLHGCLAAVAANAARDFLRRQRRREAAMAELCAVARRREEGAPEAERGRWLREAVGRLPAEYRITLRFARRPVSRSGRRRGRWM